MHVVSAIACLLLSLLWIHHPVNQGLLVTKFSRLHWLWAPCRLLMFDIGGTLQGLPAATAGPRLRSAAVGGLCPERRDARQPDLCEPPRVSTRLTQDSERVFCVKDGRLCRLCGLADNSADPLAEALGLQEPRWWGVAPQDNKTVGTFCGYCMKVWVARYRKTKGWSLGVLAEKCGVDQNLQSQFLNFLKMLIQHIVKVKARDGRAPWQEFDKELVETEGCEMRLEAPTDRWMELADYRDKFGDPLSNGKNHSVLSLKGKDGVLIPGERVWKIKKADVRSVAQRQLIHTTNAAETQFGDNDIQERLADMREAMFGEIASSGVTIDNLCGPTVVRPVLQPGASSSWSAATMSGVTQPAVSRSNQNDDDPLGLSNLTTRRGFGFNFAAPVLTTPMVEAPTIAQPKAKNRSTAKAKAPN